MSQLSIIKNKSKELPKKLGHNVSRLQMVVVSMGMQVWGKIQEGTQREGQC